ncbi:MAG: hypothetical protein P4L51_05950 [Puia sp.]|nr:hypothetical protein [Puia sp.]
MKKQPTKEAILEALKYPNGWVYEIDGSYNGKENVPPQAIRGAWKVDANGIIVGDFIPNPNYTGSGKIY